MELNQCAFSADKFKTVWHVAVSLFVIGLTLALSYFFGRGISGYSSLPPQAVFANTLGLLILVFGGLVFWIVTRPQWKRPKEPASIRLQPNGGTLEGMEGSMAINFSNTDKSDSELNNEAAARKRNIAPDESGQRSTM